MLSKFNRKTNQSISEFPINSKLQWYGCITCICSEFSLTQVPPVKGRLAQELCEAGHVSKAQVGPLSRQRMHTMGGIPAQTIASPFFKNTFNMTGTLKC